MRMKKKHFTIGSIWKLHENFKAILEPIGCELDTKYFAIQQLNNHMTLEKFNF